MSRNLFTVHWVSRWCIFCILFITCVSIVIVLHSLYKATVSALFSLVVLHYMVCEVACCTIVWGRTERRKLLLVKYRLCGRRHFSARSTATVLSRRRYWQTSSRQYGVNWWQWTAVHYSTRGFVKTPTACRMFTFSSQSAPCCHTTSIWSVKQLVVK